MNKSILCEEKSASNGVRLGIVTLNAPETLNALSLEMVDLLTAQLNCWAKDPGVALVILQGAGEKAFCAGGDLRSAYHSMRANEGKEAWQNDYVRRFFEHEYRLDYMLHTYPKPVLCWADGIVMGGGLGLMMGASHRVVSPFSRLAMPEVSIGLFPDVGASWFLNKMPGSIGIFLALTGAELHTDDAFYAGLADFRLNRADWPVFMESLLKQPWAANQQELPPRSINDGLLRRALTAMEPREPLAPGHLRQHSFLINSVANGARLKEIYEEIASLQGHEDPWLAKAATTMLAASPGSLQLAFTLQQRLRLRTLPDVFRIEYVAALACCAHGDFVEGIRALLIDKDKRPRWNPSTLAQTSGKWVEKFFREPWPSDQSHPLADLC